MTTLLIPTFELAAQLSADLEGRMEVIADDASTSAPDYEDCDSVMQLLNAQQSFPHTFEVSDAEATQAFITLENMLDFEEASEADCQAAMEHLKAQGYPHGGQS